MDNIQARYIYWLNSECRNVLQLSRLETTVSPDVETVKTDEISEALGLLSYVTLNNSAAFVKDFQ